MANEVTPGNKTAPNEVVTIADGSSVGNGKLPLISKVFILLLSVLLISVFSYYVIILPKIEKDRMLSNEAAYKKSLLGNSPTDLQNMLLSDIQTGKNDEFTKSAAYFIGHRYFDNGGNLYEIVDYINAHPELAFLKEANDIYPALFKKVEEKKIRKIFSDDGMYVLLAWLEVLDKHGYSDIAMTATLANQYAKLAYFMQRLSKDFPLGPEFSQRLAGIDNDIKKAVFYEDKTSQQVKDIFDKKITEKDITPRDTVVGLNQYAATLRYLELMNKKIDSPKTADEIFSFSMRYSAEKAPEFYGFTSLLNASTLMLLPSSSNEKVVEAIKPFVSYVNTFKIMNEKGVPAKVLKSRLQEYTPYETDYDMYGKVNAVMLASRVPDFKSWLMSNGWVESDFTEPGQKE